MVRIERFNGIRFKMTVEDKLNIPANLDKERATYEITRLISSRIEEWIIDKPEQDIFLHQSQMSETIQSDGNHMF